MSKVQEKYKYFVLSMCFFSPHSMGLLLRYFHKEIKQLSNTCTWESQELDESERERNNDSFICSKKWTT
jgi:hypothetical protein